MSRTLEFYACSVKGDSHCAAVEPRLIRDFLALVGDVNTPVVIAGQWHSLPT
jgi:hypothetical protein